MGDLTNPRLIWCKGVLFLLLGLLSAASVIALAPEIRIAVLLGISIWAFCRFYYFTFYVIQHYIDPGYRFSGLIDFVRYAFRTRDIPPPPAE